MLGLVGNPKDRFCGDAAHILNCLFCHCSAHFACFILDAILVAQKASDAIRLLLSKDVETLVSVDFYVGICLFSIMWAAHLVSVHLW